jgi:hypothetical protein
VAAVLRLRCANCADFDVVPKAVVEGTCELARELLLLDRTAAPAVVTTGSGATYASSQYSKGDTRPIISGVAQAMLANFGALISGAVRLMRG